MLPYVPPWLCDRLFRNLLIDAGGNTHRAGFSIDKLFAPESASGRLGLVELRAFEMPPHEAESRRLARFFTHSASQGRYTPPPQTENQSFPFTLDLRSS